MNEEQELKARKAKEDAFIDKMRDRIAMDDRDRALRAGYQQGFIDGMEWYASIPKKMLAL